LYYVFTYANFDLCSISGRVLALRGVSRFYREFAEGFEVILALINIGVLYCEGFVNEFDCFHPPWGFFLMGYSSILGFLLMGNRGIGFVSPRCLSAKPFVSALDKGFASLYLFTFLFLL